MSRSNKKRLKCGGKVCYESRAVAKRAHKTSSARLRFYACPDCKHWHATNRDRRGGFTRSTRAKAPYGTKEQKAAGRAKGRKVRAVMDKAHWKTSLHPLEHKFITTGDAGECWVCGRIEGEHRSAG